MQVLSQRQQMRGAKVNGAVAVRRSQKAVAARADYIGSTTNIIFITSTTLLLAAGAFDPVLSKSCSHFRFLAPLSRIAVCLTLRNPLFAVRETARLLPAYALDM